MGAARSHSFVVLLGRSIGWYGMALVEVLETMPKDNPDRPKLIALVRQLVGAFERCQDPKTGLWYNVVDRPNQPGNWLESSASSMYIYVISKAVQRGYVQKSYEGVACNGYHGMLAQLIAKPTMMSVLRISVPAAWWVTLPIIWRAHGTRMTFMASARFF